MSHEPNWQEYGLTTGSDKQKEPVDVHDENYGKYHDTVADVSVPERLPTAQMPMAPAPMPFVTK